MGHPILTALFLIAAGLMLFRVRDWTHRWIGIMLISAGMNIAAGISNETKTIVIIVGAVLISVLCMVGIFEEPKKNKRK